MTRIRGMRVLGAQAQIQLQCADLYPVAHVCCVDPLAAGQAREDVRHGVGAVHERRYLYVLDSMGGCRIGHRADRERVRRGMIIVRIGEGAEHTRQCKGCAGSNPEAAALRVILSCGPALATEVQCPGPGAAALAPWRDEIERTSEIAA